MPTRAAATISLSGPLALQGRQAARGLELWASADQIELEIVDDAGRTERASEVYQNWLNAGTDLLLGPYGSNLMRRVGPITSGAGVLLWNHGGSADDLARPLVVPVSAPASSYFSGTVDLAHRLGLERVMLAKGKGRFAAAVTAGARERSAELGLTFRARSLSEWSIAGSVEGAALLIVGTFTEDLALVKQVRAGSRPGLIGCVAAGLLEFGDRLGPASEGIVGPAQWISEPTTPEVGPAAADFTLRYERAYGEPPGYVAAQAAATGFLSAEAAHRGYDHDQVRQWRTTTLLGSFALNVSWRQVGHTPITIEWRDGRQVRAI
ncbi:MAG: ABC transporter substrate-binding protein [Acidobacteria bacterium]|nr:ABC transporter substrate-binding protein [Acidobacteriota bacterium]